VPIFAPSLRRRSTRPNRAPSTSLAGTVGRPTRWAARSGTCGRG
jgi:hypothetical protein